MAFLNEVTLRLHLMAFPGASENELQCPSSSLLSSLDCSYSLLPPLYFCHFFLNDHMEGSSVEGLLVEGTWNGAGTQIISEAGRGGT